MPNQHKEEVNSKKTEIKQSRNTKWQFILNTQMYSYNQILNQSLKHSSYGENKQKICLHHIEITGKNIHNRLTKIPMRVET